MCRGNRWTATVALLAWIMLAPAAFAQEHSGTPLEIEVPFAPQAVSVGGAPRLFYEFHLASHARGGGTLGEIEIRDGDTGAVLSDEKGPALDGLILRPGIKDAPAEPRRMSPGSTAVVFMETTLPVGGATPRSLRWRLSFSADSPADATAAQWPPAAGEIAVDQPAPITVGFPLQTGAWVALNGPSNTANHRRTLLVVDGRARIAQRYAIDWVKLGPDGRLFHGDRGINANWYCFGTGVLAVADATVSAAIDGIPQNDPGKLAVVPITLETIGGNYLILDLGGGLYAFYAHLQPGSQRVRVGDKVRRGQVIALLGNTGNSDGPHLHFHISNANNPAGAEGVPYVFAAFSSLGVTNFDQIDGPAGWKPNPAKSPILRKDALPAENEVVDIP